MSRPLRIEYEGAWYHVMNRGINRMSIFKTNNHRHHFLNLLAEIVKLYFVEIHGYCLMKNHYHLLIKTPYANLSKAIRHLNCVYTLQFNRSIKRDGPLFRGRYKGILIEENAYLLQVSRYIHLNPVAGKLCQFPQNYTWSSYKNYIGLCKASSWLETDFILGQIGGIKQYEEFVTCGIDKEISNFYTKKYMSPILGTKDFKKKMIDNIGNKKLTDSFPDVKRTRNLPEIATIVEITSAFFQVDIDSVRKSVQRRKNLARQCATYLARRVGLHAYQKIADYFGDISLEGVRSSIRRIDCRLKQDTRLNDSLQLLIKILCD